MSGIGSKRSCDAIDETVTGESGNSRNVTIRIDQVTTTTTINALGGSDDRVARSMYTLPPAPQKKLKNRKKPPALYPHQIFAINRVLESLSSGVRRIGVSAATGSGKTVLFVTMIHLIPYRGEGDKVLIIVPSVSIMEQVMREIRRSLPRGYVADREQASWTPLDGDQDIIVATWQSLSKRIQNYDPAEFKCVIVDEAHHSAADSYLRELQWFNDEVQMGNGVQPVDLLHHGHRVPIIGFSGTMARDDDKPLGWVYEEVIYHVDIETLLRQNFLSPIRLQSAWSDVARLMKDFAGSQREFAQSQSFFDLLIRTYIARAGDRRSTLVFCPTVIAAKHMTDSFTRAGIRARYVCNDTPKPECRGIVDDFNAGRFEVLVNCKMFTEGVDMPGIDAVILGNPTRTQNVVNQMLGRGTRLSRDTGKTDCILLDMFDVLGQYGIGVKPSLEPKSSKK